MAILPQEKTTEDRTGGKEVMTFDKYLAYAEESRNYSGAEMLMAEIGYGEDVHYSPENWARVCEIIYAAARGDVRTIIGSMSARAFALRYGIAPRTVQGWLTNHAIQPPFALALGYAVIGNIEEDIDNQF